MKAGLLATLIVLMGCIAPSFPALGASSSESSERGGIPLSQLLESVAKNHGKNFVVDPRVQGSIHLYGQDVSQVGYDELLTILNLNGYAAVEEGGRVLIVPDATIRMHALPVVSGNEKLPGALFVTALIRVKSVPSVQLVPILRPLLPQAGHLAALPCRNTLIVVDTFANLRRLRSLIESLDTGEALPAEKCEMPPAPLRQGPVLERPEPGR